MRIAWSIAMLVVGLGLFAWGHVRERHVVRSHVSADVRLDGGSAFVENLACDGYHRQGAWLLDTEVAGSVQVQCPSGTTGASAAAPSGTADVAPSGSSTGSGSAVRPSTVQVKPREKACAT